MNMNILEQEDLIKGATDDILLQEAKSPTGRVPQFLVISEIQRRKSMRDRFSAQDGQPEQSVAEQIVAGAAPQGIGALQPPPQMPPQAPVMAMPPPQMPPEMMAAQMPPMAPPPQMMAAGGGRMPYRRMADGGVIPPNALVEDASKFNPEGLDDIDPSEMEMASPTDMGIPKVIKEVVSSIRDTADIGNIGFDGRNITGRGSVMVPIKGNPLELGANAFLGSGGAGIAGLDASYQMPKSNLSLGGSYRPGDKSWQANFLKRLKKNRYIKGQLDSQNNSIGVQYGGRFNQGGLVGMAGGGSTTYQAMKDDALSLSSSVLGKGEDLVDQVIDFYSEEDGTTDWGKVATHIAYTGLTFTPWGLAARGAQLGVGIGKLLTGKAGKTIASNLAKKIGQKLGHKIPVNTTLKAKTSAKLIANNPQIARELAVQSTKAATNKGIGAVGTALVNSPASIGRGLAGAITKYPKITRTIAGSMILDDVLDPRTGPVGSITKEVIGKDNAAAEELRQKTENEARALFNLLNNKDLNNKASGGIVRMNDNGQVPDQFTGKSQKELEAYIKENTAVNDAGAVNPVVDPVDARADGVAPNGGGVDSTEAEAAELKKLRNFYSNNIGINTGANGGDSINPIVTAVNPSNNTNQQLLDMMAESRSNIEDISSRFKDIKGPDYEELKAGIREGVKEDAISSILMSMAKSISEGKGLAGADVSGAQKIRQRAKDAMNAITLAESRGASEKELADLNRELQTEISLMAPFSALQTPTKRKITTLETLQERRATLPPGLERDEVDMRIKRMTEPSAGDIVAGIIKKMEQGVPVYDPVSGQPTGKILYGDNALTETDHAVLDKARQTGLLDKIMRDINVDEFVGVN